MDIYYKDGSVYARYDNKYRNDEIWISDDITSSQWSDIEYMIRGINHISEDILSDLCSVVAYRYDSQVVIKVYNSKESQTFSDIVYPEELAKCSYEYPKELVEFVNSEYFDTYMEGYDFLLEGALESFANSWNESLLGLFAENPLYEDVEWLVNNKTLNEAITALELDYGVLINKTENGYYVEEW